MLLAAMHALHSESTSHIMHISSEIMRFATVHGFHLLMDPVDEETLLMTKVWSCAYMYVSRPNYLDATLKLHSD